MSKKSPETAVDPYMKGLTPLPVSEVELAFPANVKRLMPSWLDIPEEFRDYSAHGKWNTTFSDMFYVGIKNIEIKPKDGIDPAVAWNHLRCIMRSYEPKHEHKEAACAYLMSIWFEYITYEKAK